VRRAACTNAPSSTTSSSRPGTKARSFASRTWRSRARRGELQHRSPLHGRDAVGFGVIALPTANALDVNNAVLAELQRLAKSFPPGLQYAIAFNTTTVVQQSINEVIKTLLIAVGLVVLVIFLFLQSWRATLIPTLTMPVSWIGAFAFVHLLGFSINT
jgi:HAE1 family hydrophobic/amphiphilic exporter-1